MSFTLPRVFRLENNNEKNNLKKPKSLLLFTPIFYFFFCHVHLPLAPLDAHQDKAVWTVSGHCLKRTVKKKSQHDSKLCLASGEMMGGYW